MSKPKTLSQEQETHINEALATLKRLETVVDILPPATYRASQRDILRKLVVRTFHHVCHHVPDRELYKLSPDNS